MDHSNLTPIKKLGCESVMMLSPITPAQNDSKYKNFHNNTNNHSLLPNHSTPPSGLANFIARNPFEADLTSRLHISVMSPTVFSKVSSPVAKSSPGFTWSIDELALIRPAKIDEFPMQQMHCSDPEMEKNAQEAISKFFSQNQIIPSPIDVKKNDCDNSVNLGTPIRIHEEMDVSMQSYKSSKKKKDSWTQTVLSFPSVLPSDVEEVLKPYFNFTQDQNCDTEEANTSNTSLRRKLFSNHESSHDE